MFRLITQFALVITLTLLMFATGTTLAGAAMLSRGEIRYFAANSFSTVIPYTLDIVHARTLSYDPIEATRVHMSPDNRYAILEGTGGTYLWEPPFAEPRLLFDSNYSPTWSPDGTRLILMPAFTALNTSDSTVYLANGDASNLTPFMPDDIAQFSGLTWSPNNLHLAYIRDDDVFVLNSADNSVQQLTDTPDHQEVYIIWSPDGQRLALSSIDRSGVIRLSIISADGTNLRHLIPDLTNNSQQPSWSPDSTRLSFVVDATEDTQVFVADVTSNELRQLAVGYDAFYTSNAGWSDDGAVKVMWWTRASGGEIFYTDYLDPETGEVLRHDETNERVLYTVASPFGDGLVAYAIADICIGLPDTPPLRCYDSGYGAPTSLVWLP